ncbi:MAG: hypothetical protein HUU55_20850 [Myxococcales bacterium]|nr:hypothetical protein [Myxococcales bacterium]
MNMKLFYRCKTDHSVGGVAHLWRIVLSVYFVMNVMVGCSGEDDEEFVVADIADTGQSSIADVETDIVPDEQGPSFLSFENACSDSDNCEPTHSCLPVAEQNAGICVLKPSDAATITDPISEQNTTSLPNLSCVGASPPEASGNTVRLFGFVDRFGTGGVTTGLEVRVFKAEGFHPEKCDLLDQEDRTACYLSLFDDTSVLLGKTVSIEPKPPADPDEVCFEDIDCPIGYNCEKIAGFKSCAKNYGLYEIEEIPTHTPLVIMVSSPDNKEDWHDTFLFNVMLFDQFAVEGSYRYDPTVVSEGQWQTVPSTLLTEIEPGNGAIGGRIRDCATDRPSWNIFGATVGFAAKVGRIGYFNDKESDALPDPSRSSTNIHGRFVGLDIMPGTNWVTATALVDGAEANLGAHRVYVFPNSLTVVSFPGQVPYAAQE